MSISIAKVSENDSQFVSVASVDSFKCKVTVTKDYWQKLTSEKISPEELVKKSFEFLLEREGPESILSEFELSLIQHYFPEYEKTIKKSF